MEYEPKKFIAYITIIITALSCDSEQASEESSSNDAFEAFYALESEAQNEVLGLMAKPKFESDDETLEEFDEDSDGSLSESENAKAIDSIRTRREEIKQELMDQLKSQIDQDQDGTVTAEEIKIYLKAKHRELKTKLAEANQSFREANQDLVADIKAACSSNIQNEDKGNGKEDNPSDDASQEPLSAQQADALVEDEISACENAKDLASDERIAAKEAKKELIKTMIAEMQAVIQNLKEKFPEEDLDSEAESAEVQSQSNEDKGKGKGKDKNNEND